MAKGSEKESGKESESGERVVRLAESVRKRPRAMRGSRLRWFPARIGDGGGGGGGTGYSVVVAISGLVLGK